MTKYIVAILLILFSTIYYSFNVYAHSGEAEPEHGVADVVSQFRGDSQSDRSSGSNGYRRGGEAPPNYKVLGAFAVINLTFLGIGAVIKIRKGKRIAYDT